MSRLGVVLLGLGCVVARAQDLVLGIYGPITSISNTFLATSVAADIDFRKNYDPALASRFGAPIIDISDLHPDLRLTTQIGTSNSETDVGVQANLDWMLGRNGATAVTGIVGGYHSAICMPVASLAAVLGVPQVSWGCTSPALSNKEVYPYFLRTIPPDSIQGGAMWRFVKSFSVPSVTFMYADEPYGAGLFSTVSNLASEASEAFRVEAVSVPYMPSNYNATRARLAVQRAMSLDSRFVYLAMTTDQGREFFPVARAEGMLGTSWQVAGSEALAFSNFPLEDMAVGYMFFTPISRGPRFAQLEGLWAQLAPDDITGSAAQAYYGIDRFLVSLGSQAAAALTAADFASSDALQLEDPFIFDAAYAFIIAANNLLNAGTALADIKGQTLLDAVKAVQFEGVSGQVQFDSNGDRLASYQIQNVQMSGSSKVAVVAAIFSSVSQSITMEDGVDLYWMDGSASANVPEYLVACRPGYFTQADTGRCQPCQTNTYSTGGVDVQCTTCPNGRYQDETGQTDCKFFELQLGIYGPFTSISQSFLAAAVAFDLDFRKNFDAETAGRLGAPVVAIPNLHQNLRIKVQIGNSNSEPEVGLGTALDFFQGQNGVDRIAGLVGGYHSAISMPIASLAVQFKCPQVSWGSTSPALSNKLQYPYFLRTIPPDSIQGGAMWGFVSHFLVPRITFAYAAEPYGEGLFQAVSDKASAAGESFRVTGVSIQYMPGDYDDEEARAKIQRIMATGSKFVFLAMTTDQGGPFFRVALEEGLLSSQYQVVGSEALALAAVGADVLPAGYIFFSPVSQGALFPQFEALWARLTAADVAGPAAVESYNLDAWRVPLDQTADGATRATDALFQSSDNMGLETPFVFDAAYTFAVAASNLMNAGTASEDIREDLLLNAVKAVDFEGISGRVLFDANGDRLASYKIENVQTVQDSKAAVTSARYSAADGSVALEEGADLLWMTGSASATVPEALVACDPGFFKDASTRLCNTCGARSFSVGGADAVCEDCPAGRFQDEAGQSECKFFELQLGIYGPMTSLSNYFLATAVMFDLDFRKNHDAALRARLGEPIVAMANLNSNLRIKVQIANSNSDPDVGVGSNLDFFQGQNGADRIVGLVGGYHSAISMPVASLATQFKCPQVSWGSTNPGLSNKDAYPYFLRTIPPDSIQGGGMWQFIETFQVPSATVVYSQEGYGEGLFQAIRGFANEVGQAFRVNGIGVRYMPTDYIDAEAVAAITHAKAAGSKVIFLIMTADQGRPFFRNAEAEALLSPAWQLVGSEALPMGVSASVPAGYIWFSPVSRAALFSRFEEMWTRLTPDDVSGPAAAAYYHLDRWRVPLNQTAQAANPVSADMFASAANLDMEAPFLFDAAYSFATAFNSLLNAGTAVDEIKEDTLLAAVQAVQFEGVSGLVAFDGNGDRLASYQILNAQPVRRLDSQGRALQGLAPAVAAVYSAATGAITNAADASQPIEILWMAGVSGSNVPSELIACEAGFYKDRVSRMCVKCAEGEFSLGGDDATCQRCPAGTEAVCSMDGELCIGATGCRNCTVGTFAADSGKTQCQSCPVGTYSETNSSQECLRCELGFYQDSEGGSACIRCPEPMVTIFQAATMRSDCVCPPGMYLPLGSSICLACPPGMTCAANSTEAAIPRPGIAAAHPFPVADPGYMTRTQEPLRVFECMPELMCPGGPPGSCAANRDSQEIACAQCLPDTFETDEGDCGSCAGFHSEVVIIVGLVVFIGCLAVLTYAVNKELVAQPHSLMTCALIMGLLFMGIQSLSIFNSMAVTWVEPLKSLLQGMKLLTFDLAVLKVDCMVGSGPVARYLLRQLIAPFGVLCIAVILVVKKSRSKMGWEMYVCELVNTSGAIFQVFFISIAISAMNPVVCYPHPGDHPEGHGMSMVSSPSTLCSMEGDHAAMVTVGVLAVTCVVLPFIALVGFGTVKYKKFVLDAQMSNGIGLQMYRFLFYRFTPDAYFYGSVMLARNFCVCLVPVAFTDGAAQLLVMALILQSTAVLQLSLHPWRSVVANWMDGILTASLVLLLLCVAMSTDFNSVSRLIGSLGTVVFAMLLLMVIAMLAYSFAQFWFPKPFYHKFICHHKADAGGQARFLQLLLTAQGYVTFIDSDNLVNLDVLFDIVRSRVGQLVVYMTASVLRRPWCAGEITITSMSHRSIACLVMPSFKPLTVEELDNLESYIDMSSVSLGHYGIKLESIANAFRWLLSDEVPRHAIKAELAGRTKFDSMVTSLLGRAASKQSSELKKEELKGAIVVVSDPRDDEATAAGGILCSKIQMQVLSLAKASPCMLADYGPVGEKEVDECVAAAHSVIVILSRDTMECAHQLYAMSAAMRRLEGMAGASVTVKDFATDIPTAGTSFDGQQKTAGFRVIPVNIPSFKFPEEAYWTERFPKLFTNADQEGERIRQFFKTISVHMATNSSDLVLRAQADDVLARIVSAPPVAKADDPSRKASGSTQATGSAALSEDLVFSSEALASDEAAQAPANDEVAPALASVAPPPLTADDMVEMSI